MHSRTWVQIYFIYLYIIGNCSAVIWSWVMELIYQLHCHITSPLTPHTKGSCRYRDIHINKQKTFRSVPYILFGWCKILAQFRDTKYKGWICTIRIFIMRCSWIPCRHCRSRKEKSYKQKSRLLYYTLGASQNGPTWCICRRGMT